VDILNSAFLEVNDNNFTKNSEEITNWNYDKFRNDDELLSAEAGYMIDGTNVEDDDEAKNWEELHIAWIVGLLPKFHWLGTRLASILADRSDGN